MKTFDANSTAGIGINTTRRNLLVGGAGLAFSTAVALAAEPAAATNSPNLEQAKDESIASLRRLKERSKR